MTFQLDENPTHLYAAPGNYQVTLEACNIEGMCNSFTDTVEALALPVADFSFAVTGLEVAFSNLSTNATSFAWAFGDETSSTEVNPVHHYTAVDAYTVTLAAMNACGDDEFSAQVQTGVFIYLPVISRPTQP